MSTAHEQPARDAADAGAAGQAGGAAAGDTGQGYPGPGSAGQGYVPRQAAGHSGAARRYATEPSGAVIGFTALAAVVMMLSGAANFFEGLAAVIRGSYFVVLPNYAFEMSVSGWGWFHLIAGIVVFIAGACLFLDQLWARVAGVFLASCSLIMNLLYIPYFPVWSVIVIALDVFVIWALLTPRYQRA